MMFSAIEKLKCQRDKMLKSLGYFNGLKRDNWDLYILYSRILKWEWVVEECSFNSDGESIRYNKITRWEGMFSRGVRS